MARKALIERQKKREYLYQKHRYRRKIVLIRFHYIEYTPEQRERLYTVLDKFPRNASFSRLRSRCWVTGRSRGFYRDFGLSRHTIREMGNDGLLPGLQRSSW